MDQSMLLGALVAGPFFGACLAALLSRRSARLRDGAAIAVTGLTFAAALWLFAARPALTLSCPALCGLGLHWTLDGFRALYCLIAAFLWFMAALFSVQYQAGHAHSGRYVFFLLWTLGATLGVFLSAGLFTTFVCFEVMSLTSYVWVAQEETPDALRAAATYLAVAVIGGLVMLFGVLLLFRLCGTLDYAALPAACAQALHTHPAALYTAAGCLLFGFGAKAGAFPLHIWLPRAHPAAPAPASALLSGILTKAGIFGVIVLSVCLPTARWGGLILLIAACTMVTGAVLALFATDLKRILACSSVSQIGFILLGAGLLCLPGAQTGLAARGTLLHMVNHSLVKLTLFLGAGAVYLHAHALDLNAIRGCGRRQPVLKVAFLLGACSLAGVPLLGGGYLSKTLLHEAIVHAAHETGAPLLTVLEWVLLLTGGLTAAYMAKIYAALFIRRNADPARQAAFDAARPLRPLSCIALLVPALCLPLAGLPPVAERLAATGEGFLGSAGQTVPLIWFGPECLSGAALSLGFGALVYWFFVRRVCRQGDRDVDRWPRWLDLENKVYRPLLTQVLPVVCGVPCRLLDRLPDRLIVLLRHTIYRDSPLPLQPVEGNLLTERVGGWLEALAALFHVRSHARHRLAMLYDDMIENSTIIGRSLSFGLFMSCAGLIAILLYLLL